MNKNLKILFCATVCCAQCSFLSPNKSLTKDVNVIRSTILSTVPFQLDEDQLSSLDSKINHFLKIKGRLENIPQEHIYNVMHKHIGSLLLGHTLILDIEKELEIPKTKMVDPKYLNLVAKKLLERYSNMDFSTGGVPAGIYGQLKKAINLLRIYNGRKYPRIQADVAKQFLLNLIKSYMDELGVRDGMAEEISRAENDFVIEASPNS